MTTELLTAAQPTLSLAPMVAGDVVDGRYRIDGVHAYGGMSAIYRATHLLLARPVALKVVSSELVGLPGAAERFLLEARATTLLKNEHVVQMFDVGVLENGAPYLVMEWLEGEDLSDVIAKDGHIPVQTAIDYVLQACEALAEVHGCGIIHRDLKPSNLFLTEAPDGSPRLKLLDFGVSKVAFSAGVPRITATGAVVGSPSYMSPEQMGQAADVDARSDVWGLGVVLYELLTKRVPFEGDGLSEILSAILLSPIPVASEIRADIPPEIDAVLNKCLQYEGSARFSSVAELAAAIAPFGPPGSTLYAEAIARLSRAAHHREVDHNVSAVDNVLSHHRSSVTPVGLELAVTREQPAPIAPKRKSRIRLRAGLVAAAIVTVALSVPAAVTHGPQMFRTHAALFLTQTPTLAATADLPQNAAPDAKPATPATAIELKAPPPVATPMVMPAAAPTSDPPHDTPHPRRAAHARHVDTAQENASAAQTMQAAQTLAPATPVVTSAPAAVAKPAPLPMDSASASNGDLFGERQ